MPGDRLLDLVGKPGGPLADAALWRLEVTSSERISPNILRVELTGPGFDRFSHQAGQDLMLRVPTKARSRVVNRRYTIRRFDSRTAAAVLDVCLHGNGPGTEWLRNARPGDEIEAIGPRGKITLRPEADWHLFVGDETAMPGTLAMLEALPPGARGLGVLEVGDPADAQDLDGLADGRSDLTWLTRPADAPPGDTELLGGVIEQLSFPSGRGHAYVAGENGAVRELQQVLERGGLAPDQIAAKAYWRRGLPNAEHGEPTRSS
jgi:NADPH-dependent ferric siderophore reductase